MNKTIEERKEDANIIAQAEVDDALEDVAAGVISDEKCNNYAKDPTGTTNQTFTCWQYDHYPNISNKLDL